LAPWMKQRWCKKVAGFISATQTVSERFAQFALNR